MISASWDHLQLALQHSFMVTIFGYGAPRSDVDAFELMKEGLSSAGPRTLNQIEIIDIRSKDQLWQTWKPFFEIHNYHDQVHSDFYDSSIARHPRRTGEAYRHQFIQGKWIASNRIPTGLGFHDLWEWIQPLIES
jgi:hypothetical protein